MANKNTIEPGVAYAALSELLFGQDHPDLANVRKTDRETGLEALTASIEADGILQPLLVWPDAGKFYVVDGSRRLAALQNLAEKIKGDVIESDADSEDVSLVSRREIFSKIPVLLIEADNAADAAQKSLAANIMQMPLHPVDQYEAFAAILRNADAAAEPERIVSDIAERFGTTIAVVNRRLAYGNLAPVIREAWRAGEIDYEGAAAFTLERDQDRQAAIFAKAKKKHALDSDFQIRRMILGDAADKRHWLKFVGEAAYEAAGGVLVRDLFAEDDDAGAAVNDVVLLKRLVDAKVEDKCKALVTAGWSWASADSDLPQDWTWKYHRDALSASKATDEQKAASGAVVSVDQSGRLSIEYGVRKPGVRAPKAESAGTKAGKADKKEDPTISQKMVDNLARTATTAMGNALKLEPHVALVAILAGVASRGTGPIVVKADGPGARAADTDIDFAEAFALIMKGGKRAIDAAIANVAAISVSLYGAQPLAEPDYAMLAAALSPAQLNKALRAAWDPAEYFEGVSKHFCLQAIQEAKVGADSLADLTKGTTGAAAEFAIANVPATGWLPPELRAPGYDGPGAKKGGR